MDLYYASLQSYAQTQFQGMEYPSPGQETPPMGGVLPEL